MALTETALRLFVAAALGALVGSERQFHQRTAGLRTNTLVAIGAAAFTVFGAIFVEGESVSRIVAQVVSGIGFLGAGAIMRDGFYIQGLNTAATIWCAAAIGTFCGGGYHVEALIFSLFIVIINTIVRRLEAYMAKHPVMSSENGTYYVIELTCQKSFEKDVRELLLKGMRNRHVWLRQLHITSDDLDRTRIEATFKLRGIKDYNIEKIIRDLSENTNILTISWRYGSDGDSA